MLQKNKKLQAKLCKRPVGGFQTFARIAAVVGGENGNYKWFVMYRPRCFKNSISMAPTRRHAVS